MIKHADGWRAEWAWPTRLEVNAWAGDDREAKQAAAFLSEHYGCEVTVKLYPNPQVAPMHYR